MKRKLVIAAACLATSLISAPIVHADEPKDGPDPNGPKCDYFDGGDTHDKWQRTPCGWIYGDEMGWQRRP
jgi:hypothetical protein